MTLTPGCTYYWFERSKIRHGSYAGHLQGKDAYILINGIFGVFVPVSSLFPQSELRVRMDARRKQAEAARQRYNAKVERTGNLPEKAWRWHDGFKQRTRRP